MPHVSVHDAAAILRGHGGLEPKATPADAALVLLREHVDHLRVVVWARKVVAADDAGDRDAAARAVRGLREALGLLEEPYTVRSGR